MNIKQISIFLENKKGRLAEVTKYLADNNINIRALSLADTKDFGVLRLIVDDYEKCLKVLKEKEFIAQVTDVIAIEIEDRPGGLYKVLKVIEDNNINIEYMYATVEKNKDSAIVIFRVDDTEKTYEVLKKNNIAFSNGKGLGI
ncbi:MAG TPA: ACT domain-containing protein [Spirochaetota bacterium]|nr:ACT domain-containing protein [Spirochaetota bacterium]HOL57131.1 ACT domain-containing protein [Spirochaetota bacterium]HPP04686.1 ACT domain-containing protein [Spirochaetota bacterium]